MLGKKLLSAGTAAVCSALLAMAVVMTTSFTPTLADGPAFCPDDSKSDDGSKAADRVCTEAMTDLPMYFNLCGVNGSTAFESHRDCMENVTGTEFERNCEFCHSVTRGVTSSGPSCFTCHGRKWDFGDEDKDGDKDDDGSKECAVGHPPLLGDSATCPDPEKSHRDHVEEIGLNVGGLPCVACHGQGGTLDWDAGKNYTGPPGCATCHDADKACDAPDAGASFNTGTAYCDEDGKSG